MSNSYAWAARKGKNTCALTKMNFCYSRLQYTYDYIVYKHVIRLLYFNDFREFFRKSNSQATFSKVSKSAYQFV